MNSLKITFKKDKLYKFVQVHLVFERVKKVFKRINSIESKGCRIRSRCTTLYIALSLCQVLCSMPHTVLGTGALNFEFVF